MISYLSGNVVIKRDTFIILDVQGVGYRVFVSEGSLDKIPEIGEGVKLFCHLHVRENTLDVYGFLSMDELDLFEIIDGISGIGPKASLLIAAIGSLGEFKKAIVSEDESFFAGVHGIGRKKIQKIILELTGKIEKLKGPGTAENKEEREVMDALVNLGFPRQRAREALSQIPKDAKTTEEKVREALKIVRA